MSDDIQRELQIYNTTYETVEGYRSHSRVDQSLQYLLDAIQRAIYTPPQIRAMGKAIEQCLSDNGSW